jgi:ribonucleotide reductase beta subunit family protein with ferritin-like domain
MKTKKIKLTDERQEFKPFSYPFAYEAWLQHEQAHWLHTEVPMLEDVKDWKNALSDKEKYFLTQIFRFFTQGDISVANGYVKNYLPNFPQPEVRMMLLGFAARECFDDKTEVLTDSGWKLFKDLGKKDLVAQMDIEDRKISFSSPTDYIEKDYFGEMHLYENKRTSICVTPNHRITLINPHTKKLSIKESSSGTWERNYLYPVSGLVSGDKKLSSLEKLLIAISADGTVRALCPSYIEDSSRQNDMTVDFHLTKKRKIDRLKKLLLDVGLKPNQRPKKDSEGYIFSFSIKGLIDRDTLFNIKNLGFIDVSSYDTSKADDFIEELIFWDGNHSGQKLWYSTNIDAVNKVQSVAVVSSYGSTIGINRSGSDNVIILNKKVKSKDCFVVSFTKEANRTYPHRKLISYNGKVYCVTMPNGTVVTRRLGKVSIQGNCTHIAAYSHLIETLGMPESTYNEFLKYSAMKEKHDYVESFHRQDENTVAQQIAVFSAFTEGMQLFSSFIMLLNFPRHGKMKGMGQIISWSIADETLHSDSMIKLFRTFIEENRNIWKDELKSQIYTIATKMVDLEDKFIELAFSMGNMEDLTADDVKKYIRYIADRRLISLGLKGIFKIKKNPLPWVEEMINAPIHGNFFENRVTDYAKGALTGNWGDVWAS